MSSPEFPGRERAWHSLALRYDIQHPSLPPMSLMHPCFAVKDRLSSPYQ